MAKPDSEVRVELRSESVALGTPATIKFYVDGQLRAEIWAEVESQKGADGGQYPAVVLRSRDDVFVPTTYL